MGYFPHILMVLNMLVYSVCCVSLAPQKADTTLYEGEGGGCYTWHSPAVAEGKLAAAKLDLQPRGFSLPHYAGSGKIGYVIQGTCTIGMVLPNSPNEKILTVKKGDAIVVPMGALSWWFNGGDSNTSIIFLGESSQSYNPGQLDFFFLAGAIGFLPGFSSEFVSKIYNINEQDSNKLANSQTSALALKLDDQIKMPDHESNFDDEFFSLNLENLLSSNVSAEINGNNFPLLDKVGLSASLVRLEPNTVLPPSYGTDGSFRIIYVIKGGGEIQIVGLNGTLILDAKVEKDQLFVVPKFFAMATIANNEGMEFFSVVTSSRPVFGELFGYYSAWNALSSSALQAALNVDSKFVEFFKSKNNV